MLNSRSFNIMKALEEAETFEINKKITVDSYHENLIESAKMNEDSIGNKTFTDNDEAEYYRNKELYANSGLARHKEAMEKAKEACKSKGIEVDETEGVYESCNKKLKEDEDTSKEERLASLKTQLEQDGDQLSDDEKEAIQAEIAELENEESLTEASTPNVEKFIYDLDVDSGNAWSVNYNDRKRGVEVYKNGKSEKTVDDIIKAVTSKYPQLKVSMKGKNRILFNYVNKDKSLKEDENIEDTVDISQEFFGHSLEDDIDEYEGPVPFDRFLQRAIDFGVEDEAFEKYGNRSRTSVNKVAREYYKDYKAKMNQAIKSGAINEAETPEAMQAIADKQMPEGGYRYMARHSIGPGTLPNDIKVFKTEDTDNGKIAMYISRPLTSEELKKYDIDPEWIQEEATMKRYKVSFYVDTDTMNNMDIEEKVNEILAGSGLASTDETIDVENITDLTEADDNKYEESEETLEDTINRAHEEELSAIETYNAVLDKTDESTDTKLIEMINEIKADEEDHKLLLQHYIETGEALSDDELEALKNSEESTEELIEESENKVAEEKVTNLKEVKSQGNIFMLQDNKRFIVGENYDEAQGLIENAEIYDNKDDADKDYLDRCDITKDGKKVQLNGQDEIDKE